jgi:hypothetical protein
MLGKGAAPSNANIVAVCAATTAFAETRMSERSIARRRSACYTRTTATSPSLAGEGGGMRKRKEKASPFSEEAAGILTELVNALVAVQDVPAAGRWPLALQFLPDEFFYRVIRSRVTMEPAQSAKLCVGLAVLTLSDFAGHPVPEVPQNVMTAVVIIMVSCFFGELERRHRVFCSDVILPGDLLDADPRNPVEYVPYDSKTFSRDALVDYYQAKSLRAGEP